MGGRISTMAEARFVGAPLRLRLGGRRLSAGAHGATGRMHAGADGRDARGQEGADRLSDRHAGKRAKLEGAARRFEGARLGCRAASSHWRWRARVLEGPRRGVPDDASSAMLAAQDIERARQAPEVDATQRAQGSARDLAVSEPGRGGSGDDDLRREIRAQIRQGSRMPDQGSSDAVDVLRPSRRSLGPLANFEPDRERVRDSEASHRPHEGALSQDTARLMVFKLVMAASKTWPRLQGQNQLPKVVNGIKFKDGIEAVAEIKTGA